jgi:hypothetical protein
MNRKAAVDNILQMAEKSANSGQYKISNTLNDLARRIALSSNVDNFDINVHFTKMAAELMFRDDYVTANHLLKIAEDMQTPQIPEELMTPEEKEQQTEEPTDEMAIEEPAEEQPTEEKPEAVETPEGKNFAELLGQLGVEVLGTDADKFINPSN